MKTEHNHYWPDGLIPITPQARRFGFTMDVYVTKCIWRVLCAWPGGHGTNPDKRIYELLDSCFKGLSKALAVNDDMLSFAFKHWFVSKKRPKAKKKAKIRVGARLFCHPETEEPWLLLFDHEFDNISMLKKGEAPNENINDIDLSDPVGVCDELPPSVGSDDEEGCGS